MVNKLHRSWTLWFDSPNLHASAQDYYDDIRWLPNISKIADFDTVEDFWHIFNNITSIDALCYRTSYYVFTAGMKPSIYDLNNMNGCVGSIILKKEDAGNMWLISILSCIGESMAYSSMVNGISITRYKDTFKMGFWLKKRIDMVQFKDFILNKIIDKCIENAKIIEIDTDAIDENIMVKNVYLNTTLELRYLSFR